MIKPCVIGSGGGIPFSSLCESILKIFSLKLKSLSKETLLAFGEYYSFFIQASCLRNYENL